MWFDRESKKLTGYIAAAAAKINAQLQAKKGTQDTPPAASVSMDVVNRLLFLFLLGFLVH